MVVIKVIILTALSQKWTIFPKEIGKFYIRKHMLEMRVVKIKCAIGTAMNV